MNAPLRKDDGTAMNPVWFGYWLAVKDKSWEMYRAGDIDGYLPYVNYIWVGERYPASHAQAGQPVWCFAYGERDWRAGRKYIDVLRSATGQPLSNPPILPVGRFNCSTGVSMP